MDGYQKEILSQRDIWPEKKILQSIYHDWYREMVAEMHEPDDGVNVELGCGCGNFKDFFPRVISTDIFPNSWVDMVTLAAHLPFSSQSVDNFIMFDVLHHLKHPGSFFAQTQEILKSGGRIVLVEPYISWVSFFLYKYLSLKMQVVIEKV